MSRKARRSVKTLQEYFDLTGVSQAELATVLGVSPSTVCLYAAGKRSPRLAMAVRISRLTGVPVEHLISTNHTTDAKVA